MGGTAGIHPVGQGRQVMRKSFIIPVALLVSFTWIASGCGKKVSPTSPALNIAEGDHGGGDWGENNEETDSIEVKIEYLDTYFWTDDGLAGYFIGLPMKVRITLTNTGSITFNKISMRATFEYSKTGCQDRWWYPDPVTGSTDVCVTEGQKLPGDCQWVDSNIHLGPGESVSFEHTYLIPMEVAAGNAWVHIELQHTVCGCGTFHDANFYDNPQQSLFDPPPRGTAD
jgi:hypothetical protein